MKRIFICATLLLAACSQEKQETLEQPTGKSLAMVRLQTFDEKPKDLPRYTNGPLVLNVWATWCAPCVKELPSLLALQESGFIHVLTVSVDQQTSVVKNFLLEHHLSKLPVLWDPNADVLRDVLNVPGMPASYILDDKMIVRGVELGERDWNHPSMRAKITKYLQEGK